MLPITDIKTFFQRQETKDIFARIYGNDNNVFSLQEKRYTGLIDKFQAKYEAKEIHLFSTSGRTEIGGNHTDHNHGRVLCAGINLDSIAIVAKTLENCINITSEGFAEEFSVDLNDLAVNDSEAGTTTALIRGIAARFKEQGYNIGGFNACIQSDVLQGSGLSSSASIEVLIGSILNGLYNKNKVDAKEIAIIGQYAENVYFKKPCGLMDQTACALGGIITIDFNDPENPVVEKIDFDFDKTGYVLAVVDTGGSHADLTDDYASVPTEMKSIARDLGQDVCRGLSADSIIERIIGLREKNGDRAILRAFHFIFDNDRVVDQVRSLKQGDFTKFLSYVTASGNSSWKWLQNCYTTKAPQEQGVTLALAITEIFLNKIGEGACRVHGGGFAGTIQVFLPKNSLHDFKKIMQPVFGDNAITVLSVRQPGATQII